MNIDTSEYYGGTYPDPPEYEEEDNTYDTCDEWDLADDLYEMERIGE